MPGTITPSTPTAVFPATLSRSFREVVEMPARTNEYHDGSSQRASVNGRARRTWTLAKRLSPADMDTLRDFWNDQKLASFYFYNPLEADPRYSSDPTGVDTTGRYTVRFGSPWQQRAGVALIDADVLLVEVLAPAD